MNCRHCNTPLRHTFLDLGFAPPSNSYLSDADLKKPEVTLPLKLCVCENCWLVQTEDYAKADSLFTADYAYFSSTSSGWLAHSAAYCRAMTSRFNLNATSLVVEVASNDGYLLKNFVAAGIPCLGIEPTAGTAAAAREVGVPTLERFFGVQTAEQLVADGKQADLLLGNNVYAHVPDINDFTRGLSTLLKPEGVVTLEFPHLLEMIRYAQFDTAYHEHYSYLSLLSVQRIFEAAGLRIWDVEQLATHGGSLRVYGCRTASKYQRTAAVDALLVMEHQAQLNSLSPYSGFQARADQVKNDAVEFLIEQKRAGKTVVGYGAAAKGNTLLNYGGVKPDLLPTIVDAARSKQGKFMPGSHIPIVSPDRLAKLKPDFVLILPWNIASEVTTQCAFIREWGGKFVVAVPELTIL